MLHLKIVLYLQNKQLKYKLSILRKVNTAIGNDRVFKNVKIAVPLKHLSNF